MAVATQLQRYRNGQELAGLSDDDCAFFPLLPDETPEQGAQKLRALLYVWKPTMMFRWSVRFTGRDLCVKKIGTFGKTA